MFVTIYAGNPGRHVRTVDIPEPQVVPTKPITAPAPPPVKERELVPSR